MLNSQSNVNPGRVVALAALSQRATSFDKRGKGRTYRDQKSRQAVKADLRRYA